MADQNILVRVGADISDLVTGLRTATSNISGFSKRTTEVMRGVGEIGKAMTGFGVGAAAGLGAAVKTAADFDTAMRKAGAIAGANKAQFNDMRQAALDLGARTSKSATEVANAMTDMAAKGFSANQVIAAMPGVISAAEASGEDLALTSDTVASALNGFGLKASDATHVADVLAMAANKTAAGVEDMQYAFKYSAPVARQLGISLEELASATGIMSNAGIKGEQAGTTLRGGLTQLLNPSEKTSKLMEKMGVKVTDANGKFVGLSGVIKNLNSSMRGMTDAQKVATLSQIVGTEAASGFLTLMQAGPAKIDGMTASLKNSAGASAETAAQMKAGIGGTFQNLQGAIETFAITIGTALIPAIQAVATWLTNLTNWFNGLPASVQTTIAVVAALAAVFALVAGPIMIIVGQIPALLTLLGLLAAAIGTTTGVLLSTVAIITGVIAAIVAIGVALVVAYNKVGWFRDMVNAAWAAIKSAWNTAITFISGITMQIIGSVSAFIGSQLAKIRAFWQQNGAAIMGIVQSYFGAVRAYITGVMGVIRGIFKAVWPILTSVVRVAWANIKAVVSSSLSLIAGVIRTTAAVMRGDWSGAWSAIKATVRNIGHDIVSAFKGINLVSIGRNIISGLVNGIKSMAGSVMSTAKGIASSAVSAVKSALKIHSPSRVMAKLGAYTGEGLAKGIASMQKAVAASASGLAAAAVPTMPTVSMAYSTPNAGGQAMTAGVASVPEQSSTNAASDSRIVQLLERIAAQNPTLSIDGKEFAKVTYDHYSNVGGNKTNLSERWG